MLRPRSSEICPDMAYGDLMNEIQQLAVPLCQSQIDAAREFWSRNGGKTLEFEQIKQVFPTCEAVRLKAILLNALYGTNIIAIEAVGDRVQRVMDRAHSTGPDLVEELVVEIRGVTKRHNYSFASKYAHFFVDSSLPILDWYAEWMVGRHVGPKLQSKKEKQYRYLRFVDDFETLKRMAGLTCDCEDLDGYLWVAGEYWYWKAHPKTEISSELRPHFEMLGTNPENEPELAKLLGLGGAMHQELDRAAEFRPNSDDDPAGGPLMFFSAS